MLTFIQAVILFFSLLRLIIDESLRWINSRYIDQTSMDLPSEIDGLMDQNQWNECLEYTKAKSKFSTFQDWFSFIVLLLVLLVILPWYYTFWPHGGDLLPWEASLFATTFLICLQIPELFWDWFRQFKLEEKFGFNKSSKSLWVKDKIKGVILGFLFLYVLICFLDWLYRSLNQAFSETWWIFAFLSFFSFQLILMIIFPKFIIPLFNKLTPLEGGELKDRLMNLAEKSGFTAKSIEVIDGSKRSSHSNAYFTGFGKFRRIVLYDTLIEQMNIDQIEAVLAHEIGHYRLGHIPKRLAVAFFSGLIGFWIVSCLSTSNWLYDGLNVPIENMGSLSPLFVFVTLFSGAFTFWMIPINNYFSRKHEYEADKFAGLAMRSGDHLSSALRQLYRKNKSFPLSHPWFSFFHHSHPSLFERERALRNVEYTA
jgi:STE24 endopeptidase